MTPPQIPQIQPADLKQSLDKHESFVLLDVREHDEVEICRIPGAVHIPMNDVPARIGELDAKATTVVYCHRGVRSNMVASYLKQQGFVDVMNLRGGIHSYAVEVDPELTVY